MLNKLAAALVVAFVAVAAHASVPGCVAVPYEYCQFGCEDLGAWVVEPFRTVEEAEAHRASLPSRVSAFVVQPPSAYAGALLLRRKLASEITLIDPYVPHWEWKQYEGQNALLVAAAESHTHGGFVYTTNQPGVVLRVWFVPCYRSYPPTALSDQRDQ